MDGGGERGLLHTVLTGKMEDSEFDRFQHSSERHTQGTEHTFSKHKRQIVSRPSMRVVQAPAELQPVALNGVGVDGDGRVWDADAGVGLDPQGTTSFALLCEEVRISFS